jgi:hypothetical protein
MVVHVCNPSYSASPGKVIKTPSPKKSVAQVAAFNPQHGKRKV